MKKKKRNMTKREAVALVKKIAKATHDPKWGIHISMLISAMRGPDYGSECDKERYTVPLRAATGWYVGMMYSRYDINSILPIDNGTHYFRHIETGREAVKALGLLEKK